MNAAKDKEDLEVEALLSLGLALSLALQLFKSVSVIGV
jgi:hypothetical protein